MNKRGYAKTILLTGIGVILVVIIITLLYLMLPKDNNPVKEIIDEVIPILGGGQENGESPNGASSSSSSSGSSSSSSSGGGGGSNGGGDGGANCEKMQLSYSIENIHKESTCNEYNGEICNDKIIVCSAGIKNRDTEITGTFKMQLSFVEDGKTRIDALKIEEAEFLLTPLETVIFEDSLNVKSTGEEGIANKEINCFFNSIEVPYKELCT